MSFSVTPLITMSYLVVLQIPTLDLLVFSTGEQVRATIADRHTAHCTDVSSQGELQFPTGQVPDLSKHTAFKHYEHYRTFLGKKCLQSAILRWQEDIIIKAAKKGFSY